MGLLRAELILEDALGNRHPRDLIEHGEQESLVDSLATAVGRVAAAFALRPVVYRASDFRTNEFRNLQGGDKYEPEEHNPMIGYRGCYRYVSNPDLFDLELRALARVREQNPNLHLMIPFVRTKWELEKCLELVDASPLGRQRGLHRWVMAEVPSVAYWLPEYVGMGIDGVSIGGNDLTQLTLGVDRDSDPVRRTATSPTARCSTPSAGSSAPPAGWASPPRCAVRRLEPAGLRRTPCADGHHVDLGHAGRGAEGATWRCERRLLLESARGRDGDRGCADRLRLAVRSGRWRPPPTADEWSRPAGRGRAEFDSSVRRCRRQLNNAVLIGDRGCRSGGIILVVSIGPYSSYRAERAAPAFRECGTPPWPAATASPT